MLGYIYAAFVLTIIWQAPLPALGLVAFFYFATKSRSHSVTPRLSYKEIQK